MKTQKICESCMFRVAASGSMCDTCHEATEASLRKIQATRLAYVGLSGPTLGVGDVGLESPTYEEPAETKGESKCICTKFLRSLVGGCR